MMMGCRSCIPSTTITITSEVGAGQLAAGRGRRGFGEFGVCRFVLALG